jgi:hypothetical protein
MSGTVNISKQQSAQSIRPRSIFISYSFGDNELVGSLIRLLKRAGFEVATGASANKFVSQAILDRIESSCFYVSVMTRHDKKADGTFTTSPWLHQELGAARAFKKHFILMVEDGVTDIGGIQGDWQRIHFTDKTFFKVALDAVEQLESYSGEPEERILRHV